MGNNTDPTPNTTPTFINTTDSSPLETIKTNNLLSDPSSANFYETMNSDDDMPCKHNPIDMKKIFADNNFPDAVPLMAR